MHDIVEVGTATIERLRTGAVEGDRIAPRRKRTARLAPVASDVERTGRRGQRATGQRNVRGTNVSARASQCAAINRDPAVEVLCASTREVASRSQRRQP